MTPPPLITGAPPRLRQGGKGKPRGLPVWQYPPMSSPLDSATDQAARRTAAEYDRIPYRSLPYPLTRPAHIAAIAQTFGLAVPAVTTARVLEIGCAGGGNIIPLAAAFPDARFVGIDLSAVQIGQARGFLEFLKEHTLEDTPYGQVVRREATILADQSDDYVMHEFLERENSPCTVVEFVTAAETAGLGHLGDAEYHTLLPGSRGPETTARLRKLAATPVQLEHYIDLVIGRTFRQSILMKPAAVARANHGLGSASIAGLHVAARFVDVPPASGPAPSCSNRSPAARRMSSGR